MRKRVLIVGASSPLGRAIAGELSALGHVVTLSSRSGGRGVEKLDVEDEVETSRVLDRIRPTVVVYLARPNLDASTDVPAEIAAAATAVRSFAARSAEQGVGRIVFASSASVYGTGETTRRRESDRVYDETPYAALKLRSEEALTEIGAAGAIATLAFRIFNLYGPGFATSLVNRLALGSGSPPPVYETENFVRDYVHVDDIARAFGAAVGLSSLDSNIVNLGTGVGTSNRSLLALCPHAAYRSIPDLAAGSFSVADISLAQKLLGFEPRIRLETALSSPERYLRRIRVDR